MKIIGEFKFAEENTNYKSFNYRRYLWQKDIYGIAKIDKYEKNGIEINFMLILNKFKGFIKNELDKSIKDDNCKKFIFGILLGDSNELSDKIKEDFRKANLSHILAISGMHIMYIIFIVEFCIKWIPSKKIKIILTNIILFLYICLIGASPSSLRAGIMYLIISISKLCYRKSNSLISLFIAFDILIIINPFNIENSGFWFTFLGTFSMINLYSKININIKNPIMKYIINNLILSVCVQIFVFPVILLFYNTISLSFFISNILVSFFISPIITLAIIIIVFKISILSKLEILLINIVFKSAEFVSNFKFSQIYVITPPIILILLYYLILTLLIFWNDFYKWILKKFKKIVIIVLIIVLINNCVNKKLNKFEIFFLDVGQGDCTIIKTENDKIFVIDGGEENKGNMILSYILDRKIKKIDYMIFSHFDSDHCGGLINLIDKIKIINIIIPSQYKSYDNYRIFKDLVENKNIKIIIANSDKTLNIDKYTKIEFLWPNINNMIYENDINNNSLVFNFYYKNISILFTGDIEEIAENEILKMYDKQKNILKADILKVAHHGSKTSTTDEFLNKVNPQIALIGVGKENKFGHPSDITVDKLSDKKIKILRTDLMGEIIIDINLHYKMYKNSKKVNNNKNR